MERVAVVCRVGSPAAPGAVRGRSRGPSGVVLAALLVSLWASAGCGASTGRAATSTGGAPGAGGAPRPASSPPPVSAGVDLGPSERSRLLAGGLVVRPQAFSRGRRRYVGGVAYQLVRAPAADVLRAMADDGSLAQMLPRTKQVTVIERSARTRRIELLQGNSMVDAVNTVLLEHSAEAGLVRFWLDPSRPHDVDDLWGYLRAEPFDPGRSLVTVAVALDLGDGLARLFFEDRIVALVLTTPACVRQHVEAVTRRSALALAAREAAGPEDTGPEDTGRQDTGRQDTGRQDTGRQDTGRQDTGQHLASAAPRTQGL